MFCKSDVRRKSIVTLALWQDNRKTVERYFVNRVPGHPFVRVFGLEITTNLVIAFKPQAKLCCKQSYLFPCMKSMVIAVVSYILPN